MQVSAGCAYRRATSSDGAQIRLRRVKCDERAPTCQRCAQAHKECLSDPRIKRRHGVQPKRSLAWMMPISNNFGLDESSLTSLRYFHEVTLPAFQSSEPSVLWDYMKQETDHSRSICFLAVALGYEHRAMHENKSSALIPVQADHFSYRAVQALRQTITDTESQHSPAATFTVVFHSLLLVILHCCRKSFDEMNVHLQHGLRIASQAIRHDNCTPDDPLRATFRLLKQYCVAVALFNPLLPQDQGGSATVAASTNVALQSPAVLQDPGEAVNSMTDDQILMDKLVDLILDLIGTTIATRQPKIDANDTGDLIFSQGLHLQPSLREKVAVFRSKHLAIESEINRRLSDVKHKRRQWLRLAKARCMLTGVYIRCRWSGYQCHYDTELEALRSIVDITEEVMNQTDFTLRSQQNLHQQPLSLGLGVLLPLSYVARLCRNPELRRRAVRLMTRLPPQDGPWDCALARAICRTIILYEERKATEVGATEFDWTSYIPEHCRVHHAYFLAPASRNETERATVRVFFAHDGNRTIMKHEDLELDMSEEM